MNKPCFFNETWKPVITAKAQLLLSASCSDYRNGNLPAPDFLLLSQLFNFQKDLGSEAKTQGLRLPSTDDLLLLLLLLFLLLVLFSSSPSPRANLGSKGHLHGPEHWGKPPERGKEVMSTFKGAMENMSPLALKAT